MHKSRLGALVIDCRSDDLSEATEFWSQALGYDVEANPDDDGKYVKLEVPPDELDAFDSDPAVFCCYCDSA